MFTTLFFLSEGEKVFVPVEMIFTGHTLPDLIILLKTWTKMPIYLRAVPSSLLISNISPLYIRFPYSLPLYIAEVAFTC